MRIDSREMKNTKCNCATTLIVASPTVIRIIRRFLVLIVISTTIACLLYSIKTRHESVLPKSAHQFLLDFIPQNYKGCEEVLPNITMSKVFRQTKADYQRAFRKAAESEPPEGFSGQLYAQFKTMHYLAGQGHVKTVCETGFNLGHSAFNFLTANDQLIVHSFDLGKYRFAYVMSRYMKKTFPGRFFIHFGNSQYTIPDFVEQNPDVLCDYIFVDGGHDYQTAADDLRNFAMIANLRGNVIIFDDYPTDWGQGFGEAWDVMVSAGVIEESMRCTFAHRSDLQRGYSMGRVVKRPV